MIGIKVCRGASFSGQCKETDPALNWGPDISDNLLTTEDAATERGAAEINENYTNRNDISITTGGTKFVSPGTFAGLAAETYQINGMLQSTSIRIERSESNLTINSSYHIEGGV